VMKLKKSKLSNDSNFHKILCNNNDDEIVISFLLPLDLKFIFYLIKENISPNFFH